MSDATHAPETRSSTSASRKTVALALLLALGAAGVLAWLGSTGDVWHGADWPAQPAVAPFGHTAESLPTTAELDPGPAMMPAVTEWLAEMPTDLRRGLFIGTALMVALAAVLIALQTARRDGRLLIGVDVLGAGLVGLVAAVLASHPAVWTPQMRVPMWLAGALALVYVALALRGSRWGVMVLVPALLLEPAMCAVPVAVWAAGQRVPLADALFAAAALAGMIGAWVWFGTHWAPSSIPRLAMASVWVALPVLIGGLLVRRAHKRGDVDGSAVGGMLLAVGAVAAVAALDTRLSGLAGWWLVLPAAAVLPLAAFAGRRPVAGAIVACLALVGASADMALATANRDSVGVPLALMPEGYAEGRRLALEIRRARCDAIDFRSAHAACERAVAAADGLRAGRETLAIRRLTAEAHLSAAQWDARIARGRSGANLPVATELPGDRIDSQTVLRHGATAADARRIDSETDDPAATIADATNNPATRVSRPWREAWISRADAFGRCLHGTPASQASREMALALLMAAPDRVDAELFVHMERIALVVSPVAAEAARKLLERPGEEALALEPDDIRSWIAALGAHAASRSVDPVGPETVRASWRGGDEAGALLLARAPLPADHPARDRWLLLRAQILFNRFNRLAAAASTTAGGDDPAGTAAAALTECRETLATLLALPTRPTADLPGWPDRRTRLDARRLEAFTWQFGPAAADRGKALPLYESLTRDNPPVVVGRSDAATDPADSGTRRKTDILPGTGEPDVRFLAGVLHLQRDNSAAAAEAFADELQRDPGHTLARYQLGRMQLATAQAAYAAMLSEYTPAYRALPGEEQLPEVETLPAVPLWALERAFSQNPAFHRKLNRASNLVNLAWNTDPANADIRALFSTFWFFRGDAQRALGRIDLAEPFLRQAYVAWEDNPDRINGVLLRDKLGHFYAEVWQQRLDADEDPEAMVDLLGRALKISQYVRDQLYEFAKAVIQDNPDIDPGKIRPFYEIAVELYPEWVPGQHWMGSFHRAAGRFADAEPRLTAAVEAAEAQGREEFATLLLELGQFYVEWAAARMAEGLALADNPGAPERATARVVQHAADLLAAARERTLEHMRFSPGASRAIAWQTMAVIDHERYRIARQTRSLRTGTLLDEAIASYQEFLEPQSADANMQALRNLMTQRILMLQAQTDTDADQLMAAIADYEEWVPDPSASITGMRDRARALALADEGDRLMTEGDVAGAMDAWGEAVAIAPRMSRPHDALARAWLAKDEPLRAVAEWRLAAAGTPPMPLALFRAGRAVLEKLEDGRPEALHLLREFLQMTAGEPPADAPEELPAARAEAADLVEALENEALALAEEGAALIEAGDAEAGRERLRAAVRLDRSNAELQFRYAGALEDAGDTAAAELHYVAAAGAEPPQPLALYHLALIWREEPARRAAAMDALRDFMSAARRHIEHATEAGHRPDLRIRLALHDAESVEQGMIDAAHRAGDEGLAALAAGDPETAARLLLELVQANPACAGRSHGYKPLLDALMRLERYDKVVAQALRGLEFDWQQERHAVYHLRLGQALVASSGPLPGIPALLPLAGRQDMQLKWAAHSFQLVMARWPASRASAEARLALAALQRID